MASRDRLVAAARSNHVATGIDSSNRPSCTSFAISHSVIALIKMVWPSASATSGQADADSGGIPKQFDVMKGEGVYERCTIRQVV
jgi:hypothetical protein